MRNDTTNISAPQAPSDSLVVALFVSLQAESPICDGGATEWQRRTHQGGRGESFADDGQLQGQPGAVRRFSLRVSRHSISSKQRSFGDGAERKGTKHQGQREERVSEAWLRILFTILKINPRNSRNTEV